jgi:predicted transcriptional regulator
MSENPKLENIFAALSDDASIRIFKLASTGFESGNDVPKKIDVTPKQFYSRMRRLLDNGLIAKDRGFYRLTTLGMAVANTQVKPLEELLANYWKLVATDELRQSKAIPEKEREKVTQSLFSGTGLTEYLGEGGRLPIKIISTYEELIKEVLRLIELARTEIHIASRYHEPQVSKRLIEKFAEGVSLNILDGNPSGTSLVSRLQAASTASNPATQALVRAVLESPRVRIRNLPLEYSLVVVDRLYCGFEQVNPLNPHEFNLAVEFGDAELSQRMVVLFERLWNSAEITVPHNVSSSGG